MRRKCIDNIIIKKKVSVATRERPAKKAAGLFHVETIRTSSIQFDAILWFCRKILLSTDDRLFWQKEIGILPLAGNSGFPAG
jgi:hypothetical protein